LIAWLDHEISGRPAGPAVEHAALYADPLLHLLLLAAGPRFLRRGSSALPAALLAMGMAAVFPFAAGSCRGRPTIMAWYWLAVLWSVLPLLAGIARRIFGNGGLGGRSRAALVFRRRNRGRSRLVDWRGREGAGARSASRWVGGSRPGWLVPRRREGGRAGAAAPLPWGSWALGGAAASLAGYLIEFFPSYLGSWQLRVNHPLYGLAWLGGAVVLKRVTAWIERRRLPWSLREAGVLSLAVVAVAGLPVVMRLTQNPGFLEMDLSAFRLTRLPGDAREANLWAWLVDEFFTPRVWATVLPVLLVLPAVGLALLRRTGMASRASLAVALGPAFVTIGYACWQLRWWNQADAVLLGLLVAATAAIDDTFQHRLSRWIWPGFLAPMLLLGAIQVLPQRDVPEKNALEEPEFLGLIERDLARWLAGHAGPVDVVILAPHDTGAALYYYGGLRGLATLGWENRAGLEAAVRIVSASTPEEAKELMDRRGITYVVIPSWDSYLDSYARMGMGQVEGTALKTWHDWNLPPWLRPVPYQIPSIAGCEGQSVAVLEVVEEQDAAAALSRIAEYFVEMQQLDPAAMAGQALRRYPADLGALAARAQVEIARGDTAGFASTVELLQRRLSSKADRGLPWDRRVSLAIMLARGKHMDLARDQVLRCLAEVDEAKLRSLTTDSLYRLHVLWKAFDLAIPDQRLRGLALELLPADMRRRL
jgi:hypothetical protein